MAKQKEEFQSFICWEEQKVGSVIAKDIGAISETDEFLFLAVHGEMKVEDNSNKLPQDKKMRKVSLNSSRNKFMQRVLKIA